MLYPVLYYQYPYSYALCSATQKRTLQVQQNRCLRNDVVHRDTSTSTVEEFIKHITSRLFARVDNGPQVHLHGIAPLHRRPPEGRPLARELLQPS
ncbi:unnamed protein product [Euphydryas editha]|uniref:Uncharacterized protein n=1 Tax=Euphydryas editha TaxID=104508 RepID=A0AAU9V4Q4_EUPED|nr:unnamed protein product [Euphydryas editha]